MIGNPEIYLGPELDEFLTSVGGIEKVFGFVNCEIQAPRNLRIPSVPVKINDKLMFALCRSCAEEERKGPCPHDDDKRTFSVHIATPEVRISHNHRKFFANSLSFSASRSSQAGLQSGSSDGHLALARKPALKLSSARYHLQTLPGQGVRFWVPTQRQHARRKRGFCLAGSSAF